MDLMFRRARRAIFFFVLAQIFIYAIPNISKAADVSVDANQRLQEINPLILGNNIQWVDYGDNLLDPATHTFNTSLLDKVKGIKVSALRFPGGTQSDAYHWKDGLGPYELRKPGLHVFTNTTQPSFFGTDEFLDLSGQLNAEPVITVNVLTGTAEEAADWVAYANAKNKVTYWEIGNEPYLQQFNRTTIDSNYPEQFAQKFIEFAAKMKAVDPTIKVGLPLRSNLQGQYPGTPYTDFNQRVLSICGSSADFVSVHNAYFSGIFDASNYNDPDSFLALMAAVRQVREDIELTKSQLQQFVPSKNLPIAITEHNTFFAVSNLSFSKMGASLAGGLYTSLLLSDFLKDKSLLMANFWSLSGNWYFGAISQSLKLRPQYYALKIFSNYVGAYLVQSSVANNTVFSNPSSGYMPAKAGTPALEVLTTISDLQTISLANKRLFIIIINRSPSQDMPVLIKMNNFIARQRPVGIVLNGPFMSSDNETTETVSLTKLSLRKISDLRTAPKHSVIALSVDGS